MADPAYGWRPDTSGRGVKTPVTRMAPRLAPIPRVYDPTEPEKAKKVVRIVKKPAKKPVILRARPPIDDQFNATLDFSPAYGADAGRTYGPLSLTPGADSPEGNKEFYCRVQIEQHRVDPLLQGFKTLWDPPPGWTIADGLDTHSYDEAISNPLYITRVYLTPSTISLEIGFKVTVQRKCRP
jgi:hypothetical protein